MIILASLYFRHLVVTIDILKSLTSFCPEVVVTLRSIQSYASQLLVKMVTMKGKGGEDGDNEEKRR